MEGLCALRSFLRYYVPTCLLLVSGDQQKGLEVVEEIFEYEKPGSIKFIGTPAWSTHVGKSAPSSCSEKGEMSVKENAERESHDSHSSKERMEDRTVEKE